MASRLLQRTLLRPNAFKACRVVALSSTSPQQGPPLAPRRHYAHAPLAGKNIFQLRAAAEVAAAAADVKKQPGGGGGSGKGSSPNENPYEGVVLPTSDESEELLRIRHSVSGLVGGRHDRSDRCCARSL
jgi:hypothetical protein